MLFRSPRFAFEKFHGASTTLGTQMKSVGEVMAIGRTFKQAYLKAVRSLEAPLKYHDAEGYDPWFKRELDEIEEFRKFLGEQFSAAKNAESAKKKGLCDLCDLCGKNKEETSSLLIQAKVFGFSDKEIAAAIGSDEITVRNSRLALGIRPEFGEVDTCAGEFEAVTPYYYSYYGYGTTETAETTGTTVHGDSSRTSQMSQKSQSTQSQIGRAHV